MEIKQIILSSVAPNYTRAIWAHPIDGDIVELKVFNNGEWQSTTVAPDLSGYLTKVDASNTYQLKGDYALKSEIPSLDEYSTSEEIAELYQTKTDETLDTNNKTVVGAINEIFPKATGVGKVDSHSDGTGEIFNSYSTNLAAGSYTHAEGINTKAYGYGSHAEGHGSIAGKEDVLVTAAHAEGAATVASGYFSHTEGSGTVAQNINEHAEGKFNLSNNISAQQYTQHSVGIGTSDSDRKNAHEIMNNGDHYIFGLGGYDGTNAVEDTSKTLQEVINNKAENFTAGIGLEMTSDRELNVTLDTTVFYIAETLPGSPAAGNENKICLIPSENTGEQDIYTEYLWVVDTDNPSGRWEKIGEFKPSVDLTPYLTIESAQSTYLSKSDATNVYLSKTEASNTYQPIGDYATSTELTEGLAAKQNAGDYATTAQLQSLQETVDDKADMNLLPSYTVIPTLSENYSIPANATTREQVFDITVGETLYNITYDSAIVWVNGLAPVTRVNHRYLISVINNLGAWGEFEITGNE